MSEAATPPPPKPIETVEPVPVPVPVPKTMIHAPKLTEHATQTDPQADDETRDQRSEEPLMPLPIALPQAAPLPAPPWTARDLRISQDINKIINVTVYICVFATIVFATDSLGWPEMAKQAVKKPLNLIRRLLPFDLTPKRNGAGTARPERQGRNGGGRPGTASAATQATPMSDHKGAQTSPPSSGPPTPSLATRAVWLAADSGPGTICRRAGLAVAIAPPAALEGAAIAPPDTPAVVSCHPTAISPPTTVQAPGSALAGAIAVPTARHHAASLEEEVNAVMNAVIDAVVDAVENGAGDFESADDFVPTPSDASSASSSDAPAVP